MEIAKTFYEVISSVRSILQIVQILLLLSFFLANLFRRPNSSILLLSKLIHTRKNCARFVEVPFGYHNCQKLTIPKSDSVVIWTALWFDAIVCMGRLINGEVGRDNHALHVLCSANRSLDFLMTLDRQFVYLQSVSVLIVL